MNQYIDAAIFFSLKKDGSFFAVAGISIAPTHAYTSLWRKLIPFVLAKNIRGVSLVPYNTNSPIL